MRTFYRITIISSFTTIIISYCFTYFYVITCEVFIVISVNAVFLLFAGFAIAMLLSITSIVSQDNGKVRKLTQQIALLENRIRELENKEK